MTVYDPLIHELMPWSYTSMFHNGVAATR